MEFETDILSEPMWCRYSIIPGQPERWYTPSGDPGIPGVGAEVEITSIENEEGDELLYFLMKNHPDEIERVKREILESL